MQSIKPFKTGNEVKLLFLLDRFVDSVAKEDKCLGVRAAISALGRIRASDKGLFRNAVMYLSCLALCDAPDTTLHERVVGTMDDRSRRHFLDLIDSLRDARIEAAQKQVAKQVS